MAISGVSSTIYVPPSNQTQGAQGVQNAGDPDNDGDGGQRVQGSGHHHGKGRGPGPMQDALMQALQSLGLSPATATSGTSSTFSSSTSSQSSGKDSDGDSDGSTSATGNVKSDIRQFMHALFQAVKGQSGGASSTNSANATNSDPKSNFATGLASLISQVSSGNAPSDLQNAFSQVVNDLQGNNGSSVTSGGTSTTSIGITDSSAKVTLQALLSKMQQNLGYGATSGNAAVGNFLNEQT